MLVFDVKTPGIPIQFKQKNGMSPVVFEAPDLEYRSIVKYLKGLGVDYTVKHISEKRRKTKDMKKQLVHAKSHVKLRLKY